MIEGNEKYKSWIPRGFRFYNAPEARRCLLLQGLFREMFGLKSYQEIIPPALDYLPTFQLTASRANHSGFFETRDSDGEALAFRSDLTVQVVKAAASGRLGENSPGRFSYIQPVFHDQPWGSGHKREILQAGVELIGDDSNTRFSEILDLARVCLERAGFVPSIIYGDVRFLDYLFKDLPADLRESLSESFHNKDTAKIVRLCQAYELDAATCTLLSEIPLVFGSASALEKLRSLCRNRPELTALIDEAATVKNVLYDFSLVRHLSYYTGPVFEAYIPQSREKVLSGGIYDDLFKMFSGKTRTACGFAANLTILSDLYDEKGR